MTTAAFSISVDGGAPQTGGIDVTSAAVIEHIPTSTVGWLRARWEYYDYPEGWATPAGWSLAADGTIYYEGVSPPDITLPSSATLWGVWMLRCMVNEQIYDDQNVIGDLLCDSNALCMPSPGGLRDMGAREEDHFTTSTTRVKKWLRSYQRNLRMLETLIGASATVLANSSTGTINDVATTSGSNVVGAVRMSGAAPAITGLASGTSGRRLVIMATGGDVTLANESGSSTAANRIVTGTGGTVTVSNGSAAMVVYDATSSRWRLASSSGGGGGGGGTPGGSNTQVQYNNSGAFGGISGATSDGTNLTVVDANFKIADNSDATKKLAIQCSGITTATTRTLTVPDANTTIVGTDATQTITNKTIWVSDANLWIYDNVDPTKGVSLQCSGLTTATTRTLTVPDADTTIVGTGTTQTLTNKTINATDNTITDTSGATGDILRHNGTKFVRLARGSAGQVLRANSGGTDIEWGAVPAAGSTTQVQYNNAGAFGGISGATTDGTTLTVSDSAFIIADNSDATKKLAIQCSGITTATTRTLTVPDADTTIVGTDATQTLTNKTLTSPTIGGSPVFSATSLSFTGNARCKTYSDIANVQTTDATATSLFTWTITDEATTLVTVEVLACKSDGTATAVYVRRCRIKRDGGTVTVGTVEESYNSEDGIACTVTIDNSTSTGRVRVTGVAATTIDWGCVVSRIEVTHA